MLGGFLICSSPRAEIETQWQLLGLLEMLGERVMTIVLSFHTNQDVRV